MTGRRIEFPSDDAARFNALRDEWRGVAAGCAPSRSALRIATVLPTYVNREFGYAYPTDDDLRGVLNASKETVKRGLADLEQADLIERETRVKRDEKGEAAGRERRIYLTIPGGAPKVGETPRTEGADRLGKSAETVRGEGSEPFEVKGQKQPVSEGSTPAEVKGQEVKGQPEVKGQKRAGEGSYGGPNILDSDTPDLRIRSGDRKVSVYGEADPSPLPDPSPRPATHPKVDGLTDRAPIRPNPYPTPKSWGTDAPFLALFDRSVSRLVGDGIGAGQIEGITAKAFDEATRDNGDMPFFWPEVCKLTDPSIAEWFRFRASTILHHREAA